LTANSAIDPLHTATQSKSMFEPKPYLHDPVPLIECFHGIEDVIIDVVGIHFLGR